MVWEWRASQGQKRADNTWKGQKTSSEKHSVNTKYRKCSENLHAVCRLHSTPGISSSIGWWLKSLQILASPLDERILNNFSSLLGMDIFSFKRNFTCLLFLLIFIFSWTSIFIEVSFRKKTFIIDFHKSSYPDLKQRVLLPQMSVTLNSFSTRLYCDYRKIGGVYCQPHQNFYLWKQKLTSFILVCKDTEYYLYFISQVFWTLS